MTWRGTCSICGQPVTGGGQEPDVPAGQQKVAHLLCLLLKAEEEKRGDVAESNPTGN